MTARGRRDDGDAPRRTEGVDDDYPAYYNEGTRPGTCPECGIELADVDVYAHAIQHYGEEPLPQNHRTLTARQRRAELLGEEVPVR